MINVNMFVSVIPTIEATVAVTVIEIVIFMMMKPKMMMEFRVKVIPKVDYLRIGFNKWCAP